MKIHEVEACVGITKKNIRFYEARGLLEPRRNSDNGYREYTEQDLQTLRQIKLLRKLGVPVEEIRQMLDGHQTLADGMRRHRVSLEREQRNLEQSLRLCEELQALDIPLAALDAQDCLERMEALERDGTRFRNRLKQDVRVRYVAPVIIAAGMLALLTGLVFLLLWAYRTQPQEAPPMAFLAVMLLLFMLLGVGVLLALWQRIREIGKGEIDDAKNF